MAIRTNHLGNHFLLEVVDPITTKEAMPVFRYRARDLTRLLPGSVTSMRHFARSPVVPTT